LESTSGRSRSHFPDSKIILRRHAERIGYAIEEREHGDDVDSFRDLVFGPARGTKLFHIFGGGTVGGFGNELGVIQQGALRLAEASFTKLAFENGCDSLIGGSLNTQEVGVAVQSIRAAIQERNMASDHLLGAPVEVAFGKMDRVGEVDDLTEKIRAGAETLDDAGNLLPSGTGTPVVVSRGGIARGGGVFGDFDLCVWFCVIGGHGV